MTAWLLSRLVLFGNTDTTVVAFCSCSLVQYRTVRIPENWGDVSSVVDLEWFFRILLLCWFRILIPFRILPVHEFCLIFLTYILSLYFCLVRMLGCILWWDISFLGTLREFVFLNWSFLLRTCQILSVFPSSFTSNSFWIRSCPDTDVRKSTYVGQAVIITASLGVLSLPPVSFLNDLQRARLTRGRMIWLLAHPLPSPLSRQQAHRRHKGRLRKRGILLTPEEGGRAEGMGGGA